MSDNNESKKLYCPVCGKEYDSKDLEGVDGMAPCSCGIARVWDILSTSNK